MTKSQHLQTAIDAAHAGARVALDYYSREKDELRITHKEDHSILTVADGQSEQTIKDHILSVFPESVFIAEESENSIGNQKNVWIIDPIDGTREFSRGIDMWGILIAYALDREVTVGVCYFPMLDIMVYAEKNCGAYINDVGVSVSQITDLKSAYLGFSPIQKFKGEQREKLLAVFDNTEASRSFITSYSGFCVASGKLDFYISSDSNKIWDIAPFLCIIPEAGGKVSTWEGKTVNIENERAQVVASNGVIHDQVLEILNRKK